MEPSNLKFDALTSSILRVIYLRPSNAGDEAIAVGVIYKNNDSIKAVTIESTLAPEALRCLEGEYAAENTMTALKVIKQHAPTSRNLELIPPTSNLFFGEIKSFLTDDVNTYARDYLNLVSSLLKERPKAKVRKTINQSSVGKILYDEVSKINVIKATKLFQGYKIEMRNKRSITFPIFGEKIIAAPVSMTTSKVTNAKNLAEAYCAKFMVAREHVVQKPSLYILIPSISSAKSNINLIEDSLGELELVAEANDINVRIEKNPTELANAILHDDS